MIAETHFKINLGLNILEKLPNGYHSIETVFYPVCNQRDIIEIQESDHFVFEMEGADFIINPDKNLCVKAYHILQQKFGIPSVLIKLNKKIPSGAGIGGGSGDAATTLLMLNDFFHLSLSKDELITFAAQLRGIRRCSNHSTDVK
jgi:4-diphosphocytidyl-2-C-methyl-D-erythritol kinase